MAGRIQSVQNRAASLPIIGKLKIGDKKKNAQGTEYPVSLDYFKADGKYAELFHEKLGAEPRKIRVAFLNDNINDICNERFESWDNGKVRGFKYGEGDGVNFTVYDAAQKKYVPATKDDEIVKALKWQSVLTIRFVALDLPGIMGQWQLTTRGVNSSIPNIVKSFDFVKEKAGTIIGLPFDLTITKNSGRQLNNTGSGVQTTNFPVINLIPNFTEESVLAVRDFIAKGGNPSEIAVLTMDMTKTKQLEAPTTTDAIDVEVIEQPNPDTDEKTQ